MTEMGKAYGSAENEMSIIEESLDFKINRLKETWVGALQEMIDRGDVGKLIDNLTKLSEVFVDLIENLGVGGSIVAGTGLRALFMHFDQIKGWLPSFVKEIGKASKVAKSLKNVGEAAEVAEEITTPFMEAVEYLNGAEDAAETIGTVGEAITDVGEAAAGGTGELSGFGKMLVSLAGSTGMSVGRLVALGGAIAAVAAAAGIVIYEYNKAEKEIAKFAKDLGKNFEESSKDIEGYKTEIKSLYEIIKSETSTTDQRREARERLLAIQDEMIGKYGAEASTIGMITDAINGEIDALDRLTVAEWERTKRAFNKENLPGLDSWVRTFNGAKDNVDLMLKEMENQTITLEFQSEIDADFIREIQELYGGDIFDYGDGQGGYYTLSGNMDELQEKLVKIQKTAESMNIGGRLEDDIAEVIDMTDEAMDSYGEFYKQYVLYERILGTDQEKHLNNINNLIQTYRTALANEQNEEAEKALQSLKEEYKDIEVGLSGLDEDAATSIRMFFESLPPMAIKVEIDKKQLREELDEAVEGGGTRGEQLAEAIGRFSNKEQLFNFDKDAEDAPEELKEAYKELDKAVIDTGVSLENIYDYLVNTKKEAKELPTAVADAAAKTLEKKNFVNSGYSNLTGTEIYQSVINIMSKLDEEQQLAWIHAAEKANDYTDAVLRGNEAVEKLKETTEKLNEEPIEFSMSGLSETGKNLKSIQSLYAQFVDAVNNEEPTIHLDLTEVEGLREMFQGIGAEEDFNIFESIVTDANSSAEQIQTAFDSIATTYATAQINMQGATEQTSAILKSQLVEWGFTKESVDAFVDSLIAEAGEQNAVAQITEIVTDKNNEFKGSEDAKIQALIDEAEQLGLTKAQLVEYLTKAHEAGFISFNGDTSFLERLRTQLGLTVDEINNYKAALASIGNVRSRGYSSSTDGSSGKNGAGLNQNSEMGKRILEQQKAYEKKQAELKKETLELGKNSLELDKNSSAIKSNNAAKSGGGGGGGSKAADEAKEEKDALQELSSQLDEVQDAWKKLSDIQKDYAKTGKITVDQAQELINIDYRYLAMLNLEGDAMAVNEAAFQSLAEAKLNEMKITLIRKAIDLVNTFVDEAKAAEYLTNSYFYLGAGAAQAAGELAALYQAVANVSGMSATQAQAANTVLQGTLNALKMLDHVDLSTAKGDSSEAAENAKDNYENLFDYFERRVKVLQNAVSLLNAELENVNGSFAKNKLLDAQGKYNEQMLKDYTSALEMYQEMADRALDKLPSDIADKVKNGAVEITKFMGEANEEVTEAIKDYENWADKVADCRQQIAELKEALRQLELQKFNNIVEEFTAQFDIRQNGAIDLISKQIDLFSEAGQLIGTSFYAEQKNQTLKNIDLLQREKEALVRQMNSALDNGVNNIAPCYSNVA